MILMKDVAGLAGVSVSTISRVINKNIPVDEATREKVLQAIEKLKYKPHLQAKGLRIKSGRLIGLVIPGFVHLHAFVNIIYYILESITQHGYDLILENNHDDPVVEENFIDNLIRRNVDAIIFSRVSDESRVFKILNKENIPFVIIDRALDDETIPSVVVNNQKAGVLATRHLVSLGHRRVACITGPLNIALCRERLRGYQQVLSENKIQMDKSLIFEGDFKFESGKKAVEYFFNRRIKFTCLWAQNDIMAAGALKELHNRGLKVPDDISLVGMDDTNLAAIITPSLSTIRQPFKEMSEKAVEMIMMQKKGNELVNKKVILDPRLIVRETTCEAR